MGGMGVEGAGMGDAKVWRGRLQGGAGTGGGHRQQGTDRGGKVAGGRHRQQASNMARSKWQGSQVQGGEAKRARRRCLGLAAFLAIAVGGQI